MKFSIPKISLPKFEKKPAAPQLAPRADHITRAVLWTCDKILLFACVTVIVAVYILDVIFFSSVGGPVFGWIFVLIGLVLRSYVVGTGTVLQHVRGVTYIRDSRATLRSVQFVCVLCVLCAPINFFAASHFQKMHAAESVGATSKASTESKEARIARLEKRRTDAAANRDVAIKAANDTASIIKDQVVGTSTADNETLRAAAKNAADAVTAFGVTDNEISDQIAAIEKEKETVVTDAAKSEATTLETWEVFIWLGDQFPLTGKDPATGKVRPGSHLIWANWILFYFAMAIEYCALVALGAYTRVHSAFKAVLDQLGAPGFDPYRPQAVTAPVQAKPVEEAAPPPPPPEKPADEPPLILSQPAPPESDEDKRRAFMAQIGRKGRDSQRHAKIAADNIIKVPADDWRNRVLMKEAAE